MYSQNQSKNQLKNQLRSTQEVAQKQTLVTQTTQMSQTQMNKSATHQFLEKIAALTLHQEPPWPSTTPTDSFPETWELQKTIALLLLYRNNHPHTQWPQTPPQQPPSLPHQPLLQLTPDQEADLEEAEGLIALWEEVPHFPPNNESVTHWPQLLDDLAEEEVEAILRLEEEEATDLLVAEEEAEAQCPRMPHKSLSHPQLTSELWGQAHASLKEIEDKQETS
jgi:hypothetical protein